MFSGLNALAFPPAGLWAMTLIATLPLAWAADRLRHKPLTAGAWTALGAVPFWALTHHWTFFVSAAGVYPLVVYLSLTTGAAVWAGAVILRRFALPMSLVWPIAWVGVEALRGEIIWNGYPWYLSAHPLIDAPGAAWPAMFAGTYVVSVLTVLPAGIVLDAIAGRWRTGAIATVVLLGWIGGAAAWVLGEPEPAPNARTVRVAVVQSNEVQDVRNGWTPQLRVDAWLRLRDLTLDAARIDPVSGEPEGPQPDLIVWPEGMMPGRTLDPVSLEIETYASPGPVWHVIAADGHPVTVQAAVIAQELLLVQGALRIPMVVGNPAYDGLRFRVDGDRGVWYDFDHLYNAAFLIEDGRVQEPYYRKQHLTPFGEVMPLISRWPWLETQLLAIGGNGMQFAYEPGPEPTVLEATTPSGEPLRLAVPICFEATMPDVCRPMVASPEGERRADLLVNITDDSWFAHWVPGRLGHMLASRWRCVELATPMVRSANTGVSCAIDDRGRVISDTLDDGISAAARTEGVLTADVELPGPGLTIYARTGEIVAWAVLGLAGGGVLAGVWPRRRAPGHDDQSSEGRLADEP